MQNKTTSSILELNHWTQTRTHEHMNTTPEEGRKEGREKKRKKIREWSVNHDRLNKTRDTHTHTHNLKSPTTVQILDQIHSYTQSQYAHTQTLQNTSILLSWTDRQTDRQTQWPLVAAVLSFPPRHLALSSWHLHTQHRLARLSPALILSHVWLSHALPLLTWKKGR